MADYRIETYKSLIALSIESFKFSALSNGGAAVALLAYLGNIAGKITSSPDMRCPMLAFLTGLTLCGFSMLFGYITQLKLHNEIGSFEKPMIQHNCFLWLAIALYAASLVAFGLGSWQAVIRF
jgi:hypothetical protein